MGFHQALGLAVRSGAWLGSSRAGLRRFGLRRPGWSVTECIELLLPVFPLDRALSHILEPGNLLFDLVDATPPSNSRLLDARQILILRSAAHGILSQQLTIDLFRGFPDAVGGAEVCIDILRQLQIRKVALDRRGGCG